MFISVKVPKRTKSNSSCEYLFQKSRENCFFSKDLSKCEGFVGRWKRKKGGKKKYKEIKKTENGAREDMYKRERNGYDMR